ncbi:TonB-dependent hemoglobin/transferrin/lactoferrin family receptor [Vibrio cholerae]|uniref:TonB-dependent hemoglobin/transferrin/lactoferrin family receptor n=1 Tax=Vibrio cholerae TaxID=666 RepID=UPI001AE345A3|nr:TonB-dependent hemoglobin/transferrin/lactoferrin family receptor [Vibrio cholerae]EGR1133412.1 TonB-dependent hemoglobin/transferrin/lactoferrin family receptor [Vibrio cholerae]EGR3978254.1 TonB-dependent hemoglobin/transferrin/lactoferrin family receptor [Vibrio cholerae]EGR4198915.1 TonB-dependent hemoglobin/transferrin/lactoferrin family receptor [Vibrio cholerae]ELJ8793594.1 TonB-dependent hemoglobin/transferrin/lactoferrin family receptor [Vibrio cholerae]ELN3182693.1 TonB-dependent 
MYKKSLLSSAIMLALVPSAYAEQESQFNEVVVTATRSAQGKQDVAASIDTVSAKDIDSSLATNAKDALKYTPGVEVKSGSRFGISGFNIRGMEDSRILTVIDGVQQPVGYNPGASEQRKYSNAIEVDTLQSIEVNKGPSSTLYGSDALGGLVQFRTKNPSDVLVDDGDGHRFGIKSTYTSVDEQFKNTLTWAMREGKLETLVMATYAQGHETQSHGSGADIEGPKRGATNPADTDLGNVLAKAQYQANENHRLGLTLEHYTKNYDEDELNYNGYAIMPGFVYSNNFNEDVNKRTRISLEHQWLMNALLADESNLALSYQDSSSLNKNYDTTPSSGARMRERDSADKALQFDAQFNKLVEIDGVSHDVTYGGSFLNNAFSLENTDHFYRTGTSRTGSTGVPDADIVKWGLFAQDQLYLMDEQLILTAGLRYDSFEATPKTDAGFTTQYQPNKDNAFTGKLGAVYHLKENLALFGQISQGFKAPTVYDLYYFYNQGAIIEANPDLKAERSISYEVGTRGNNAYGNMEFAVFINDYKDFITQTKTGQSGGKDVISKYNIDEVRIYGAELSSTLLLDTVSPLPHGSYARLAVAYAHGEDKATGKEIDTVAPLTSVFGLGYDQVNFGSALNVKMVASKDEWQLDNNLDVAGYTVVDLTAYYVPVKDLTVRAGLFNLFDKKYWHYSDISGKTGTEAFNIDYQSQPGRNWGISLDYQF